MRKIIGIYSPDQDLPDTRGIDESPTPGSVDKAPEIRDMAPSIMFDRYFSGGLFQSGNQMIQQRRLAYPGWPGNNNNKRLS